MRVLLTRPQGRNQAMVEALTARNISHIVTPLLQVQATTPSPQQSTVLFNQADIVIFISTNAVKFAAMANNAAWSKSKKYYAIGEATYLALQELGISAQKAPADCQQTEGLLTLPELQSLTEKKIVIVRGIGGREALAEALTARGATVSYWEAYQRTCPKVASEIIYSWQQAKVDTIIVTSGEILTNLIKLVPKELFAWLRACHIIVPSSRVQQQAFTHGLTQVTNAKAANSKATLLALGLSL